MCNSTGQRLPSGGSSWRLKKTPPECVSTLKLQGGGINKATVWKIWGGALVMVVWVALGSLLIKHRNDNGTEDLKSV